MVSFARSGGTLLNRCLGSLSDVVIMSEVNALGGGWSVDKEKSLVTIKTQAKKWYSISLKSNNFVENASELARMCQKQNKNLIIRDWSYINFVPHKNNNFNPSYKLKTYSQLKHKNQVIPFVFLRNTIDVWISLGTPPIEQFSKLYLKYTNELIANNIKIFKYENFCKDPSKEMVEICKYIGIKYDNSYKNYNEFVNVNGDVQNKDKSRGIKQKKIKELPRKKISFMKKMELKNCQRIKKINDLLEYKTIYDENIIIEIIKKIYRKIKNTFFLPKKNKAKQKWVKDEGDKTLRLDYNLNKESIVFDIGGYKGEWSEKIYNKYNCNIYIFEPVKKFFDKITEKFYNNEQVKVFNFGLSGKNSFLNINIDNDSSSTNVQGENKIKAEFKSISSFVKNHKIKNIDLIKINIEGDEYNLLNDLLDNNLIKNIKNIQVQFHDFILGAKKKMKKIQKRLKQTHKLTYQYIFIWENWRKK